MNIPTLTYQSFLLFKLTMAKECYQKVLCPKDIPVEKKKKNPDSYKALGSETPYRELRHINNCIFFS